MRPLTLSIDPLVYLELKSLAEAAGIPVRQLVREVLDDFVKPAVKEEGMYYDADGWSPPS